ncbi:hypothetical protein NDK43_25985 [Neobacillus pocheonensis]|uniref:Uncharacterized protein n=1 Tax=Neobacillus pocheonensis TaxID=363869 RepID=A0ABT0WHT9_9BACI|nr:hypothetical protein [Neobacillus pocheonensis]
MKEGAKGFDLYSGEGVTILAGVERGERYRNREIEPGYELQFRHRVFENKSVISVLLSKYSCST